MNKKRGCFSNNPGSSIPQNAGWYSTKATYEFYKNKDISLDGLKQIISSYGSSQVSGVDNILIAHDFCQISYNDSAAEGLGYLANKEGWGIIARLLLLVVQALCKTGGRIKFIF